MDSSERVLEALSDIEGATQDASRKACAALEDGTLVEELPHVDKASVEASLSEATDVPSSRFRWSSLTIHGA